MHVSRQPGIRGAGPNVSYPALRAPPERQTRSWVLKPKGSNDVVRLTDEHGRLGARYSDDSDCKLPTPRRASSTGNKSCKVLTPPRRSLRLFAKEVIPAMRETAQIP